MHKWMNCDIKYMVKIQIICIILRENKEIAKPRLIDELSKNIIDIEDCNVQLMIVDRDLESAVRGCYNSHVRALKLLGGQVGLVLEEDCHFTRKFNLSNLIKSTSNNPITRNLITYVGYNAYHATSDKFCDDQLILTQAMTTHAMIILNPTILLEQLNKLGPFANTPIDVVYHQIAQPAVGVWPILALQNPGWSTTEGRVVDYTQSMISRSNFFHEIMYPEEVQIIFLDNYPPDVRFKLRRQPITTIFPEIKFSRVIIVVDGNTIPDGWAEYSRDNKLDALFQTRSFVVGIFSMRISAMSREYYSRKSPYLTLDTPLVDVFYPPFRNPIDDSKYTIKSNWMGDRGIRSKPIVMFVCPTSEHIEFLNKLKPNIKCTMPLISGPDINCNQVIRHPIPDYIFSFDTHPFIDATCDKDTKIYIICKHNANIILESGFNHMREQIKRVFQIDISKTNIKLFSELINTVINN